MHLVCLWVSTGTGFLRWFIAILQIGIWATLDTSAKDDRVQSKIKFNCKLCESMVGVWCLQWFQTWLGGMVAQWTPSLVPWTPSGAVSIVNSITGGCDTQSWYPTTHTCVAEAVEIMALVAVNGSLALFVIVALPTWRSTFCINVLLTKLCLLDNFFVFVCALFS